MNRRYKDFRRVLCENGGGDFPESFTQNLHRIITRMKEASKNDGFEAVATVFDDEVYMLTNRPLECLRVTKYKDCSGPNSPIDREGWHTKITSMASYLCSACVYSGKL